MPLGESVKVVAVLLVLVVASVVTIIAFSQGKGRSECSRPPEGFLIIASSRGFNDSVDRLNFTSGGEPSKPWPVISVAKGSSVKLVVCNTDTTPHGFQIEHYYTSNLVSIAPGTVLSVTFTANVTGTFRIYCQIPCPIHLFMQYGQLAVK